MSTIKKFEDLIAWQKSRTLVNEIYKITSASSFATDFSLRDQIRRASVSIMSNIAEGFERNGNREFINFLSVSKASAGEAKSQLYIALDLKYITQDEFTSLFNQLNDLSKVISGLITYLKNSGLKGSKFSEDYSMYHFPADYKL